MTIVMNCVVAVVVAAAGMMTLMMLLIAGNHDGDADESWQQQNDEFASGSCFE